MLFSKLYVVRSVSIFLLLWYVIIECKSNKKKSDVGNNLRKNNGWCSFRRLDKRIDLC